MNIYYRFLKAFAGVVLPILFRWQVEGKRNIPQKGGVLICANHSSWWDPVYISLAINRPVYYMAKEDLFRIPVFGGMIRHLGAFPVKRKQGDLRSIRRALELLRDGNVVCIFPEGTRNRSARLLPGHPGASMLAVKSRVPVIPLAIRRYPSRLFQPIQVCIGPMIDLSHYAKQRLNHEQLTRISNEVIMRGIADLSGTGPES